MHRWKEERRGGCTDGRRRERKHGKKEGKKREGVQEGEEVEFAKTRRKSARHARSDHLPIPQYKITVDISYLSRREGGGCQRGVEHVQ